MTKVYINDPNNPWFVSTLEMPIIPRIGETIIVDYTNFYKVENVKYDINNDNLTEVIVIVKKIN